MNRLSTIPASYDYFEYSQSPLLVMKMSFAEPPAVWHSPISLPTLSDPLSLTVMNFDAEEVYCPFID